MKSRIINFESVPGKLDFKPKKFIPIFCKMLYCEVIVEAAYKAPTTPDQLYKIAGIGNILSPRIYSLRFCIRKNEKGKIELILVEERNRKINEVRKVGVYDEGIIIRFEFAYNPENGIFRYLDNKGNDFEYKAPIMRVYQLSNPYAGGSKPIQEGKINVSIEKMLTNVIHDNKLKEFVYPLRNSHVFLIGVIFLMIASLDSNFLNSDAITTSEVIGLIFIASFIIYTIYFTIKSLIKK